MTHLLIIVLDDLERMPALLQAWKAIGVPGVTILESVGAYRATSWLSRVGWEALAHLYDADEVRRRTLLSAIEDDNLLAQAVAEAEQIVGGFDRPNSGLLLVLPIAQAKGLHKSVPRPVVTAASPPAGRPEWVIRRDTPVERVAGILDLEPTIVHPETPLDEVALAMLARPASHVACVVAADGRLVGLISLEALTDDLFLHIMPEESLSEVTDLEQVVQFALKSRMRTAGDAMQPPAWVKRGETVKDAFRRMHVHHVVGLPVVDEQYRVVGYINFLGLLAACLRRGDDSPGAEARL